MSKNGFSWLMACFQTFLSQISLKSESSPAVHRFLLSVRYTYSSSFHFERWWNLSLSFEGDTQKVLNHQTTSRHIRADCKLVTHHIFASVNNSLLFRYQTLVFISVHPFKLLIMKKFTPYFEGKLLTESTRKWGAMENASTSEEVMMSREDCIIWTCMTSTPRKM